MTLKITTLIEDQVVENKDLFVEHGISFFIETPNAKILFDTGLTGDFVKNAEKMGINLQEKESVVISHGHDDHGGGFKKLVEKTGNAFKLYVGKDFFVEKFIIKNDELKFKHAGFDQKYLLDKNIELHVVNDDILEIAPGIFVFTNFNRAHTFETINEKYKIYCKGEYKHDIFVDEVSIAIDTPEGLVVLVGCAHPGVINILDTIIEKTGKNVYAILGGVHLIDGNENRIKQTIEFFLKKDIKLIGTSHCTGDKAVKMLQESCGKRFFNNTTGTVLEI